MDTETVRVIQTHTEEYYLAVKNEILPFATAWMDLEGIMLSEVSQRKTNTVRSSMRKLNDKQTKAKETRTKTSSSRYRKQITGCQRQRVGDGRNG